MRGNTGRYYMILVVSDYFFSLQNLNFVYYVPHPNQKKLACVEEWRTKAMREKAAIFLSYFLLVQ